MHDFLDSQGTAKTDLYGIFVGEPESSKDTKSPIYNVAVSTGMNLDANGQPVKRGRGRPRKYPLNPDGTKPKVHRQKTRPSLNSYPYGQAYGQPYDRSIWASNTPTNYAENSMWPDSAVMYPPNPSQSLPSSPELGPTAVKRGRGRPRKYPLNPDGSKLTSSQRRALKNQAAALGTNPWEAAQILARSNGTLTSSIKETNSNGNVIDAADDDDPWDTWDHGEEIPAQNMNPFPVYPVASYNQDPQLLQQCAAVMSGANSMLNYVTATVPRPAHYQPVFDQSANRLPTEISQQPLTLPASDFYKFTGYDGSQELDEQVQKWLNKDELPVQYGGYPYNYYNYPSYDQYIQDQKSATAPLG